MAKRKKKKLPGDRVVALYQMALYCPHCGKEFRVGDRVRTVHGQSFCMPRCEGEKSIPKNGRGNIKIKKAGKIA